MSTLSELKHAWRSLSVAELEGLAGWLESHVEEARYRALHVREARPEYPSEEPQYMSWAEYLAFEEQRPNRHEYVNGAVYAMSGASLAHNRIAQKLVIAFGIHLRGGPCELFFLEAKLEIRAGTDRIVYYPDVMVSRRPEDRTERTVRNPKLVSGGEARADRLPNALRRTRLRGENPPPRSARRRSARGCSSAGRRPGPARGCCRGNPRSPSAEARRREGDGGAAERPAPT